MSVNSNANAGSGSGEQPSLIGGHAQYVKGAAEVCSCSLSSPFSLPPPALRISPPLTTIPTIPPSHLIPPHLKHPANSPPSQNLIGNLTGSKEWQTSGTSDTESGVNAMKAASANRDASTDGYGKVEEVAGKLTGCEGMEKEGAESKKE